MTIFLFKKQMILKSVIVAFSLSFLSNIYAQEQSDAGNHDGGLMKQMMAAEYQPDVIADPQASARLNKVIIAETGNKNGGLTKQILQTRAPEQVVDDPTAQARLRQINLGDTNHTGRR